MRFGRRGSAGQPKEAGSEMPHRGLGKGRGHIGHHALRRDRATEVAGKPVAVFPARASVATAHRNGIGGGTIVSGAARHRRGFGGCRHQEQGDYDTGDYAKNALHGEVRLVLRRGRVDCHSAAVHLIVKVTRPPMRTQHR